MSILFATPLRHYHKYTFHFTGCFNYTTCHTAKHRDDKEKKEKEVKEELKIKEEIKEEPEMKINHAIFEGSVNPEIKLRLKEVITRSLLHCVVHLFCGSKKRDKLNIFPQEPMTQMDLDDDDDSGGEQPLYIKEDDEEEPIKEEEASMDSTDGNDTRLSDLHNTTLKTENESEEDKPLVKIILLSVV